jgi:metal-responsive CopG/Arc/MetJ family transcriptional regulator
MPEYITVSLKEEIIQIIDHIIDNSTLNFSSRPDLINTVIRDYYKNNVGKLFPALEKQ